MHRLHHRQGQAKGNRVGAGGVNCALARKSHSRSAGRGSTSAYRHLPGILPPDKSGDRCKDSSLISVPPIALKCRAASSSVSQVTDSRPPYLFTPRASYLGGGGVRLVPKIVT